MPQYLAVPVWRRTWHAPAVLLAAACTSVGPGPAAPGGLAVAESLFGDLREVRDRYEVTAASGRTESPEGVALAELIAHHDSLRERVATRLEALDAASLDREDGRALATMRQAVRRDLRPLAPAGQAAAASSAPDCAYDPAAPGAVETLRERLYACYGWAQSHVVVHGDTLDRLTILGLLGLTGDPERRRHLFLALEPVWRTLNGNNEPGSPYRRLITLEVKSRQGAESTAAAQARLSAVPPDSLEPWLVAILEAWRDAAPPEPVEPWDWYYQIGATARALASRIPRERLVPLTAAVYRALGADPDSLGVRYELEPRAGKTPVAFCTFGRRGRFREGAWTAGEPWVFATYRTGGLDNLSELLHETGHAAHIAAIRTRPAFADWPDSDPFTEALAEFVSLDVYEPAWQQYWLGDSVPLADGLRARYGGIVMDVAWAVFELRMLREPAADPDQLWTGLTRDYLRIKPHPEHSWWAMRGQLVDSPGYMVNYAVGAILIAAIRARTRELHGPFVPGDTSWYGWVAPRLFRFGLERPAREVIETFLGEPVSPAALLHDLRRLGGAS